MIHFLNKLLLTFILIFGLYSCNINKSEELDHTDNLNDTLAKTSNTISNDDIDSTYESTLADKQPEGDNITSISEIYKRTRKKPSVFTIRANRDTILRCKEGTLISIPANSFERMNNKGAIDGNVKLSVKEYYSVSDIILANLTTRSNGNIIETGGMFLISAFAKDNNDSLVLKKEKQITIALPTSQTRNLEGMRLFNGIHDSTEINWQPLPGNTGFAQRWSTDKILSFNYNNSLVFPDTEPKKLPTLASKSKQNYTTEMLLPIRNIIQNSTSRSAFGYVDTLGMLHGYLTGNRTQQFKFETDYTKSFSENIKVNIAVSFKIKISAKNNLNLQYFDKLYKMGKGNPDSLVEVILTFVPHIKRPSFGNLKNISQDVIRVSDYKKLLKEIRPKQLAYEKQVKQLEASGLTDIKSAQEYLLLSTQKLGWINCDQFPSNINKTDFIVKLNEKASLLIVFNDIKSIISSDHLGVFRNVPLGKKITIVALKTDQGKIMLAKHETVITTKPFENLQFKTVSLNEYKSELQKLNSI